MRAIMSLFFKLESFFDRYALFLILIFAFLIRLIGLNFGLPYLYHPDEPCVMNPVIKFLNSGDLNPHRFLWPGSFIMYILAIVLSIILSIYFVYCLLSGQVHNLIEFKKLIRSNPFFYYDVNPVFFHLVGRLLMVIFAVITVYLVYLVAKKLFNKPVGLFTAFCLAISPLHVIESRFIRPDIPSTMLIIASLYFLLKFCDENKGIKWLVLSSLFAGFSIATKYPSVLIVLPVLIHCLILDYKENRPFTFRYFADSAKLKTNLTKALFFICIAFFVFAPFVILDFRHALKDIIHMLGKSQLGQERLPGIQNHLWYLKDPLWKGIGGLFFAIFAVVGFYLVLVKKSYKNFLFFIFPILYFLIIGCGRERWGRWLLPILPFVAIIFGLGFSESYKFLLQKKALQNHKLKIFLLFAILFILASLPVVIRDIKNGIKLTKIDTRTLAKGWVESNLPTGSKIVYEAFTPYLSINSRGNFVLIHVLLKDFLSNTISYYKMLSVDYIITSTNYRDIFYKNPSRYMREVSRYEELRRRAKLIKIFKNKENPGPAIEIYELK